MLIHDGIIYTRAGFQPGYNLRIEEDRIVDLRPSAEESVRDGGAIIDARGYFVVPGFIDLHVHGAAGHDTMDASPAALAAMAEFFVAHGVTAFLPTTITAPHTAIMAAIHNVAGYYHEVERGARILGIHLEGPYINRMAKGAQPASECRNPDQKELEAFVAAGPVRLLTLAPELPGAEALVRLARSRGITVAIGHTVASYEEAMAALRWGATHATHTFNAMSGLHHRQPGAVGAVLTDDRLVAELIADNQHLHPAALNLAVRAKGPERVTLVTDAMRATGLPDGVYELGGQAVTVLNGACWLQDAAGKPAGTLAGSTLTMDVALRNAMQATGLALEQVLPMATRVPAAQAGAAGKTGVLAPGALADVVLLDDDYQVAMTVVGGHIVYQR